VAVPRSNDIPEGIIAKQGKNQSMMLSQRDSKFRTEKNNDYPLFHLFTKVGVTYACESRLRVLFSVRSIKDSQTIREGNCKCRLTRAEKQTRKSKGYRI